MTESNVTPKKPVPPRGPAKTFPPWKDPHLFIQDKHRFALAEIDRLNNRIDILAEKYNLMVEKCKEMGDLNDQSA